LSEADDMLVRVLTHSPVLFRLAEYDRTAMIQQSFSECKY